MLLRMRTQPRSDNAGNAGDAGDAGDWFKLRKKSMESWLTKTAAKQKPSSIKVTSEAKTEEEKDEGDDGERSKFVPCPVCNSGVSKATINAHIDACLGSGDITRSIQKGDDRSQSSVVSCEYCKENIQQATYEAHGKACKGIAGKRKRGLDEDQGMPKQSFGIKKQLKWTPLAERLRPTELRAVIGQEQLLGDTAILKSLIERDSIPSIILWGPPGCGKTTIAKIIANHTKTYFVSLSAVTSGVADVKKAVSDAQSLLKFNQQRTTLFLDEIHRFNKLQQDIFLPYVENGTITLVGATTENPSFEVNSALLSRCRVFVLHKLQPTHIKQILQNAILKFNDDKVVSNNNQNQHNSNTSQNNNNNDQSTNRLMVEEEVLDILAESADGDARTALNILDVAIQARRGEDGEINITTNRIQGAMQKTHLLYDKKSDQHYNVISALHKSMRGSDADAALYWLGRMLEGGEDPLYVARRLIRFASEDIGLADPNALLQAVAAFQASHMIGMPECNVILAQCVAYMSRAPKSNAIHTAYTAVRECIQNEPTPPVPLHISNAPSKLMKELGYGKGYKYTPDYKDPDEAKQDYLPEPLKNRKFLFFTG